MSLGTPREARRSSSRAVGCDEVRRGTDDSEGVVEHGAEEGWFGAGGELGVVDDALGERSVLLEVETAIEARAARGAGRRPSSATSMRWRSSGLTRRQGSRRVNRRREPRHRQRVIPQVHTPSR